MIIAETEQKSIIYIDGKILEQVKRFYQRAIIDEEVTVNEEINE